jgi:diguanylate cyclase (GGDEF)-like protein/PAS domain S-box-containing protein
MSYEQMLMSVADRAPGLIAVYNIQTGQYLYVNKAVTKILGYKPDDFINGGVEFAISLIHPDDTPIIMAQNASALEEANREENKNKDEEFSMTFEYRMKHKEGHWVWLRTEGMVFRRDANGDVKEVFNVSFDISDRKRRELELLSLKKEFEEKLDKQTKDLQERERMFRSLIEVVEDYAIFHLDNNGRIMSWNEGIGNIFGYTANEVIGLPIDVFYTAKDQKENMPAKELQEAIAKGTIVNDGIRVRKDGTTFFAVATTTPIRDENGEVQGFSKIIRDVTELKEAEETIRYHAMHDTLTGLANRKALDDHFNMSKSMAVRNGNKIGLIFMDLDRFKTINDTLGHGVGDLVLKEVAKRLKKAVRKVDIVARLGGDEFVILINEVHSAQNIAKVAGKILETIRPLTRVQDHSLHITASMGIAMFADDGQDIYSLLKNADTALYRAKDAGRNRYQFYDYSMNLQSGSKLSLEQDLRSVVTDNQLFMEYQPFVDIKTGRVMGMESLVRWNHPKLGTIYPFDFIPLAEETGMIVPIGKWILETVCRQGKEFQKAGFPLRMTVNLSGRQFSEAELVQTITETLEKTDYNAEDLELEITESVAMENIARTSLKLNDLKELGISISIDDFGTGYSSLSYLKRFPVQKLKIDKSFVKHAITDPQDSTIIRAIISMGQSLGLSVCAEGVEDEDQYTLLRSMDCDIAQGYLISKPLPVERVVDWLKNYSLVTQAKPV